MVANGGAPPRGSAAAAASLRRRRPGGGGGGAAAGGASTMLQFYTDDATGAKMSPNTVLFMSIGFIAVVALLHVVASSQFSASSGAIIGPGFCVPYPIDLTFFVDAARLNYDHLAVADINGNLSSVHDRWLVFMGNSSDPKHLLFSVKRSSALQFKTELDVFLAANTKEEVCDFKIKGSFRKRSCAVYKGDSSMVIAQHVTTDGCLVKTRICKRFHTSFYPGKREKMSESSPRISRPDAIVDPRFCASYPIDLTFFVDASWLNRDHLAVTDTNGNVVFKVEVRKRSLRSWQVVVDASGKPVISMREKLRSVHDRWQVFKGDSSDPKDLLFSVRRSSPLQFKTVLDVFLAANTKEEACDFKMKGSYRKRSCTVYKGDASTVAAQVIMSKEYKFVNSSVSKEAFGVAINPNTDYSFIAALVIIQHELHKEHL
ncbi:hypothetical protein B296_00018466 [Ensete ventricosum]|uniref:Tubby C-terminal domain-containing protein n=1 Tax=Ensete ventricosum TaxID=4639 RepID=A0A427AWR1_ENSVE|nr:hypothetical protein B296_00018466 [Ensete ventricosum]